MSDSLRVLVGAQIDAYLTKDAAAAPASSADNNGLKRNFTAYSESGLVLDAATYPPAAVAVDLSQTLTGTTHDFDLTAAPLAEDINRTVDLTGKRLIAILAKFDKDNNVAGMTLGPHPTTNEYEPFGAGIIPLFYPGFRLSLYCGPTGDSGFTASTPAVAAGAKALRLAGAIGDAVSCLAIFG